MFQACLRTDGQQLVTPPKTPIGVNPWQVQSGHADPFQQSHNLPRSHDVRSERHRLNTLQTAPSQVTTEPTADKQPESTLGDLFLSNEVGLSLRLPQGAVVVSGAINPMPSFLSEMAGQSHAGASAWVAQATIQQLKFS